jgi:hypothetical protein
VAWFAANGVKPFRKFSAKPEKFTQPCLPSRVQIQPYIERLNAGGTQIPLRNPISLDTEPLLEPVGLPPLSGTKGSGAPKQLMWQS